MVYGWMDGVYVYFYYGWMDEWMVMDDNFGTVQYSGENCDTVQYSKDLIEFQKLENFNNTKIFKNLKISTTSKIPV